MKIAIIGAGNVGATCAMRLLESSLGDIVLLDIVESLAKGKAEDLMDCASITGHKKIIKGTSDYKDIAASEIVVITAGLPRKPGMTREELLNKNAAIVKEVASNIIRHTKNPIIVVVTNPLDAMAHVVYKVTGLDSKRVIGMAGLLDSSRMNLMASRVLNISVDGIETLVLGTHGETMVATISQSRIRNRPLDTFAKKDDIDKIIKDTKARGAEILSYLGTGSAFYAPSAGVFRIVKAIINDTKEVLPCSCFLSGEYGISGIFLGVPARISKGGIKEVIELPLSDEESRELKIAAESVREQLKSLKMGTPPIL